MTTSISALTGSPNTQIISGASMRMPASQKMSNLFDQIDTTGSGTITKAQFEQAFQTLNPPKDFKALGADAIWAQLDPNNTGSVSKQDFVSGMTAMMKQLRGGHHHHHRGSQISAATETPAQTISASAGTIQSAISGSALNTTA
jgi:hypothetical protein